MKKFHIHVSVLVNCNLYGCKYKVCIYLFISFYSYKLNSKSVLDVHLNHFCFCEFMVNNKYLYFDTIKSMYVCVCLQLLNVYNMILIYNVLLTVMLLCLISVNLQVYLHI